MNVLVVEDEPAELRLASAVLRSAGHSVSSVAGVEGALTALLSDHPDVILLDMWLPGVDGLALIRALKADAATRDIHIVAVTSYPEKFPKEEVLLAGGEGYLVKPLSTRTLAQTLTDVVGGGESGP